MKKTLCFVVLIFLVFNLCGCSSQSTISTDNPSSSNVVDLNNDQYYLGNSNLRTIAEGPEAYYFISRDFLYYMDKTTLSAHPLCNKPDCLHDEEQDYERMDSCNARLFYPYNMFYYDGFLYILQWNSSGYSLSPDNCQYHYLCKYSLQGEYLETVTDLPFTAASIIQHQGIMYYSYYELEEDAEEDDWGMVYLMSYDLKSGKKECLIEKPGAEIYDIGELFIYKNYLYARVTYFETPDSTLLNCKCLILNLDTNIWTELNADDANARLTDVYIREDALVYSQVRFVTDEWEDGAYAIDRKYSRNMYTAELDGTNASKETEIAYAAGICFTFDDFVLISSENEATRTDKEHPQQFAIYQDNNIICEFDLSSIILDTQYDSGSGRDESHAASTTWARKYSLMGDSLVLSYMSREGACLVGIKIADLQKGQANPQVLFEFPAVK